MIDEERELGARGAALREAFDASFAAPVVAPRDEELALIVVVGEATVAVRLAGVAQVFLDRPLTPVPSDRPALLGLAALGGAIVPVFDLGRACGRGAATAPRYLLVAAEGGVAFAVDALTGTARLARGDAAPIVTVGTTSVPLISLAPLVDGLRRSTMASPAREDR